MQLASINPIAHHALDDRPYNLCFAEHTSTHAYFRKRAQQGATVILDSLVHEHLLRWGEEPNGHHKRIDAIKDSIEGIQPTYTIVPNVIGDLQETLRTFFTFCALADNTSLFISTTLMGVLGGNSLKEIVTCARIMAHATNTLAIPIEIFETIGTNRYSFYNALIKESLIPYDTIVHFLGLEADLSALHIRDPHILGCDSAKPFHSAIQDHAIAGTLPPHIKRPDNFFGITVEPNTLELARANIAYLDSICATKAPV